MSAGETDRKVDDERLNKLIRDLRDKDEKVRLLAVHELMEIGDARAVKPLLRALADENKFVSEVATRALERIGEPAIMPLLQALRGESWYMRQMAAEALVKIGKLALKPLIQALEDEDKWVRFLATWALGEIGDVYAVEPLLRAFGDRNSNVRAGAMEALVKIGKPAVEPLIRALEDEDKGVQWRVVWVLGEIGDKRAINSLLHRALKKDETEIVPPKAEEALKKISEAQFIPGPLSPLPPQIFICYAREDVIKARKLFNRLNGKGFSVWWDKKSIKGGERWKIEIIKAIKGSDFFLACLSRSSVSREGFFHREINEALEVAKQQPEDAIYLIPLRLDNCKVPEQLSEYHVIDLFKRGGFKELEEAIEAGMARREQWLKEKGEGWGHRPINLPSGQR
ncbi:MAG: HEAT repeat domain-containing protein [Anaerolineae bacterium]